MESTRELEGNMTVPESLFRETLKKAIKSGEDGPIDTLAGILYAGISRSVSHESTLSLHAAQFEHQNREFQLTIDSMKEGFTQMEKRFEQVDKRFEQVDKRFEQVDKRFEQVDKRFEQVDKRFEQVDKRFEDINKRFTFQSWLIGIGFVTINTLLVIMKVIK